MNIVQLKKVAKRSWQNEWEGKEILKLNLKISESELPYFVLDKQISHWANMLSFLDKKSIQFSAISQKLIQAKLIYIFRYEWEYSNQEYPFNNKWIYYRYKEILCDRELSE